MKKIILVVFTFHFSLFTFYCFSQPTIQWAKCLGGSGDDEGYCICQTNDGGYIVGGFSNSHDGNLDSTNLGGTWIVKLDANGVIKWERSYGGAFYSENPNSIIQTSDGGYIFAGNIGDSIFGYHGGGDAWVVKLDDTGNVQWQKCYGGTGNDLAESILQTNDGGFIFTGQTLSNDGDVIDNHGNDDAWIVKLDDTGAIQWSKCYGGTNIDGFSSIKQLNDSGYILAGGTCSNDGNINFNHGSGDAWIIKIDSIGNIQWGKTYGGSGSDEFINILPIGNGYIAVGNSNSNDGDVVGFHGGLSDYWIVKLNDSGAIEWQHCYGGTDQDQFVSFVQTPDGGYAMGGYTLSTDVDVNGNHGASDYWIVKTDTNGIIQWSQCYGGYGGDNANQMILANDRGLVIVGLTDGTGGEVTGYKGGLWDYWVVKLAPDSMVGIDEVQDKSFLSKIYPNPNNGNFSLEYNLQSAGTFNLYDVLGQELLKEPLQGEAGIQNIYTVDLSSGIYFWEVATSNGVAAKGKIGIIK
jgi:hypothetical protein